ncbi:hypothetical protein H4219_004176 [Mycoemilia scoparia]|uniref:Uncharacterized protein n=1 Tax=Mycoemilia scoparia TaxID=417184 RepID=A0A9W8DRK1_9FUNG|nr:hypothetical protein H4219_004176 [Mycoemilia scoparia]
MPVRSSAADLLHVKNKVKELKPMNPISKKSLQWEMHTGIYLFEWWEKAIFNAIVVVGLLFLLYTTVSYLPKRLQTVASNMIELSS